MRISESNVSMMAARAFSQKGTRAKDQKIETSFEDARRTLGFGKQAKDGFDAYSKDSYGNMSGSDIFNNYTRLGGETIGDIGAGRYEAGGFQNKVLSMLMGRFISAGMFGGTTHQLVTYEEYESTQFHAEGRAKTDDGRIIDFNIDVSMSRSYMEYLNVYIPSVQNALCDPLIVNVGSGVANIKDQKFLFDIDSDGVNDEISMPGRGSGFLALDKNDDGEINDGSELFGTKSGDGFADLKEYDSDGNGWIDENDDVFSRLRIWCKGEDGEDILMDLKEADIGAIYLGSQATEFTLSGYDNVRDGVVRSTGFFLKESGGAGTVQHVDMAIGSAGEINHESLGQITIHTVNLSISSSETRQKRSQQAQARKREAIAKKHAAEQQTKKQMELKQLEKKLSQEKFEEKLDEQRHERRKKERERLEENMLDMLFEDRQYQII